MYIYFLYKKYLCLPLIGVFLLFSIFQNSAMAFDVSVTEGDASVVKSGDTTTITMNDRAVLEGNTSIAAGETVRIIGSSDALLRDTSGLRTDWLGKILAEGNVILINSLGVYIARAASVDVSSLIASTLNLQNENFLKGNFAFEKVAGMNPAEILNETNIKVKDGGYIVLLADRVLNNGTITAYLGSVAFGSGEKISVSFDEAGLVNMVVDQGLAEELKNSDGSGKEQIVNTGKVQADGGRIQMTAKLLKTTLQNIVNNAGVIQAGRAVERDGVIEFVADGGIANSGTIKASQLKEHGYTFGSIGILNVDHGYYDNIDGAINLSGSISGNLSDTGNINLTGAVSLSGDTSFIADSDADQTGKIIMNGFALVGNDYNLAMTTGENTTLDGDITGVHLLLLTSSTATDKTFTSTSAAAGSFSVNTLKTSFHSSFSRNETSAGSQLIFSISNAIGGVQYISTDATTRAASYLVANNIEASETASWNGGAGFLPVGTAGAEFRGIFDGQEKIINGLTINSPGGIYVGLFGYGLGATMQNIGLTNANVVGFNSVGALIGYSTGSSLVLNSYSTGSVIAQAAVGGLVGRNRFNSIVRNSHSSATVQGTGAISAAGGLVGPNYNHARIDNSYATGAVSGILYVGGLAAYVNGYSEIDNSYATGNVTGGASSSQIGGLIGLDLDHSSVHHSFATGTVSGTDKVGGLVGYNYQSSVDNSYATGAVSCSGGGCNAGGLVGFESAPVAMTNNWWFSAQTKGIGNNATNTNAGHWEKAGALSDFYGTGAGTGAAVYSGWTFGDGTGNWNSFTGAFPHLDWEWSTTITNLLQLQNMSLKLDGSYILANDIDATQTAYWNSDGAGGYYGFNPVGVNTSGVGFGGNFDGNMKTVSNLFINRPLQDYVGLFGGNFAGVIQNVDIVNANVTGRSFVGLLIGGNSSSIVNSHASGNVSGTNSVGGLAGNNVGSIARSFAIGVMAGNTYVGGLVGANYGSIVDSYSMGTVTGITSRIGGLTGANQFGSGISNSYSTANVTGNTEVGGLTGYNFISTISNSYATGTVIGAANVGGLVGAQSAATTTNSYFIDNTHGAQAGKGTYEPGGTAAFYGSSHAVYAGWNFDNTWTMAEGVEYPTFQWQYFVWDGGGATENWTEAANWNQNAVPSSIDRIFFNDTSNDNSTVDLSFAGAIANLHISSSYTGTITQAIALAISGDFSQANGIFLAGNNTISLSGNWSRTGGTFNAGTGTVIINGADQSISGDTTFYHLTKTASSDTLTFDAASTQTVTGLLTLQGIDAAHRLTLVSSTSGVQWNIDPQGARSVLFLDVMDSNNLALTAIDPLDSHDSGNNTNWFTPETPATDAVTSLELEFNLPSEIIGNKGYNAATIKDIGVMEYPVLDNGFYKFSKTLGPIYGEGHWANYLQASKAIYNSNGYELVL